MESSPSGLHLNVVAAAEARPIQPRYSLHLPNRRDENAQPAEQEEAGDIELRVTSNGATLSILFTSHRLLTDSFDSSDQPEERGERK